MPGGVLGRSAGIQFISLQNGDCTTLVPQEARQEGESWPTLGWGRFGAPAYDPGTSTLYYVDHKQGAVLRWRSGDREPSVLCQIAHKYHPLHTIWLLLNPSGTELYFGWAEDISDRTKLVECSVATGRTRTIAHDIDCQARPACLDDHHLLVVHYDPRRDGVAQPAVKKLDTRNGRMTSLLSGQPKLHSFSLSPSQRRILVVSDGRFRLHEFPTFRLLKDIPDGALGHQDDWGDWRVQCLIDDRHVAFLRRDSTFWSYFPFPLGGAKYWDLGTYVMDLETMRRWKLWKWSFRYNMAYLPSRPNWALAPGRDAGGEK